MNEWISRLFENPQLLKMGHAQRLADLNLGLGWLYYALARVVRPRVTVIIGSWRGFSPLVFGKGVADNLEKGRVIFIDPSLVDPFWKGGSGVKAYFAEFGITNIEHFQMTTQEFVTSEAYLQLTDVDLLFVDGYHTKEQATFDYHAFSAMIPSTGIALFHDSCSDIVATIYGEDKAYKHTVRDLMTELKQDPGLQVFDLPFDQGVTLVRKA
jgi:predicted O-methyltransferase YrrM